VELVAIAAAEKDAPTAMKHAELVRDLEGETARSFGALATAYLAGGQLVEARVTAERALMLDPKDAAAVVLVAKVRAAMETKPTILEKIKGWFAHKSS
jgi:Tfp pilus assembly protein PilF